MCVWVNIHKIVGISSLLLQEVWKESLQSVKKRSDGMCVGLLIKKTYAERFLRPEPHQKVYEIRSMPCKNLSPGEKICIISSGHGTKGRVSCRFIVGVFEFKGQLQVPKNLVPKYYALHQVSQEEFDAVGTSWQGDSVWMWHLELVTGFDPQLELPVSIGPQVWIHFDPNTCSQGMVAVQDNANRTLCVCVCFDSFSPTHPTPPHTYKLSSMPPFRIHQRGSGRAWGETVTGTGRVNLHKGYPTTRTEAHTTKFLSNDHAPVVAIRRKGGGGGGGGGVT